MINKSSDQSNSNQKENELFTTWQKWVIIGLAVFFFIAAILGALNCIDLSTPVITTLIIAVVVLSLPILPNFIQIIKFGDLEIQFYKKSEERQSNEIEDLNKRLLELETQLTKPKAEIEELERENDQERIGKDLVDQFEKTAQEYGGNKQQRILAMREMSYIGMKLGRDFLFDKLTGNLGERVGAAAALGALQDPRAIDRLSVALRDNSSHVRYQAARSIKRISPLLESDEARNAIDILESVSKAELNQPTKGIMHQALMSLYQHHGENTWN
jgi:hypothetical protein